MTSTFPNVTLSTERLVLRPFEEADLPAFTEMMNDELVAAWTSVPVPFTEEDAHHWITLDAPAERTGGSGIAFAINEFLTGRLVGSLRVSGTDWRLLSAEATYVIAPWARGEGYASESLLAAADWLFRDQKFERLELRTAADNTAAQQVAQKVGSISEGVLRNAWIARSRTDDGSWVETRGDLIVWGLLPEDLDGIAEELDQGGTYSHYPNWPGAHGG